MANPLVDAVKSLEAKKDTQGPGMGNELAEKLRMQKEAGDSLRPPVAGPERPVSIGAPRPLGPRDRPGQGPYGSQPGEKRFDVSDMQKPLGGMPKMHDGGTVSHTGPHVLKKGEKVLTPEQHGHLKNALSLAQTALAHEPQKEEAPELPKHLREMHIKELHTGGFHVTKHDGKGGVTDHGAPHNDSVIGHFMDHMSHPDEDEEDVEAGNHDMSASAAESKAIGGK